MVGYFLRTRAIAKNCVKPALEFRLASRVSAVSKRFNSSQKYRSIDDLNKEKKEYKFGYGLSDYTSEELKESEAKKEGKGSDFPFEGPKIDLLSHPRLQGLEPNSPDFKYQLHLIQQEHQADQEKQRAKWERTERVKGLGAGALALASILSVYLLATNYKYLKGQFDSKWKYDIDDSKVKDHNIPGGNLKSMENLLEKLSSELTPQFVSDLKDSEKTPGLYLFGEPNGHKLPCRIKEFDGKFLTDVLVEKDYVVAVDDRGKVFHYLPKNSALVQVLLPQKISKVVSSNGKFYYLSKNGKEVFYGGRANSEAAPASSWFASGVAYEVDKLAIPGLNRKEVINDFSAGEYHILLLSSEGRLFGACTSDTPSNRGQFGLPSLSPYAENKRIPVNEAFEMINLNNEVVVTKSGKFVKPRRFSSIASGHYFNIASDTDGNIWTWGDNSFGQCGREVRSTTDIQHLPICAFSLLDLKKTLKYSLADRASQGELAIASVHAGSNTSYINVAYESEDNCSLSQDVVLSIGSGIKGQLGLSRYMQINASPKPVKTLIGLSEYDEKSEATVNIGIKAFSARDDHVFVTLDNANAKDVFAFGDNEHGQFGNGKTVKSSKPIELPKLIEPADLEGTEIKGNKKLVKKIGDQSRNRLQLTRGTIAGVDAEQVIVAGREGSAIFYRKH